ELLDGFGEYLKGSKWLELLNIHFLEKTDPESVQEPLKKMVLKAVKEEDLQFNLELLSLIAHAGGHGEFHKMVKKTVPLLKTEEDFQDFLTICGNFYRYLDEDSKEQAIQSILDERLNHPLSNPIEENDPDVTGLLKIVK
ncbi:MAG: hypothetical protein ACE5GN_01330, partial [Waddliaceae bacterium]